ncbi:hypothetical protein GCM10023231_18220 [Olivibacter ginsenosidimutans]|uniref:Endonuclease/exonuclease/phosphatase domain-containing protein n=1 Tax=Olivibacter ginsenosidimutans TaxID=1176537 RepID=A0ABP9B7D5_9SPHI
MMILKHYHYIIVLLLFFTACKKVALNSSFEGKDSYCDTNNTVKPLRIATYNIEYDNRNNTNNLWENRKTLVSNMFTIYDFDVLAIQEPYISQLNDLKQLLPAYRYVGTTVMGSTTADKQLTVGLMYKDERLALQDSGMFWLSETPDVLSKGWDNQQYRVCNWGFFKEKGTNRQFYYFSVHLDFGDLGQTNSVALLMNKVQEIAAGYPALLAGDFNFSQYDSHYKDLFLTGFFQDTYLQAKQQLNPYEGTYNDYGNQLNSSSRIDHIFLANCSNVNVLSRKVLNDNFNGKYPSDHSAVALEVLIPESCESGAPLTDTLVETFEYATIKGTYPVGEIIAPTGIWVFDGALVYNKEPTDYRPMAPRLVGVNERGEPGLNGPGFIETAFALKGLQEIAVEFVPMPDVYDVGPDFKLEIQASTDDGVTWNSLGTKQTTKNQVATAQFTPHIASSENVKLRMINQSPQLNTDLLRGNRLNILKVTIILP